MSVEAGGGGDGGGEGDPVRAAVADADDRPMTYDEKRLLSLGINMLPGPELDNVVRIIRSVQPALLGADPNKFEIDFDVLQPITLRAIERFVRTRVPYVYEDPDTLNQIEDESD